MQIDCASGGRTRRAAAVRDAVHKNLSRTNAMAIGGAKTFDDVSRSSFAALAEEAGMRPALVLGRLDAMSRRIVAAAQAVAEELSASFSSSVYADVISVIAHQVQTVAEG